MNMINVMNLVAVMMENSELKSIQIPPRLLCDPVYLSKLSEIEMAARIVSESFTRSLKRCESRYDALIAEVILNPTEVHISEQVYHLLAIAYADNLGQGPHVAALVWFFDNRDKVQKFVDLVRGNLANYNQHKGK